MRNASDSLVLTEEQVRMVEENHNLIYSFLHKHKLPEDLYSTAGIGLCKAAASFDASRGCAFSSFAYACMYNECRRYWREEARQNQLNPTSLDEPHTMVDDNLCLGDLIAGKDLIEEVETIASFARFIENASQQDLLVILRLLQRETQVSIAAEMGCTKARVGSRVKNIRERYQEGRPLTCASRRRDLDRERCLKQEILRTIQSASC